LGERMSKLVTEVIAFEELYDFLLAQASHPIAGVPKTRSRLVAD
jgi:hypothetical protein